MATVKARITNGEIFKAGDTVSVVGMLQTNGQYRYEVKKPFLIVSGGSLGLGAIGLESLLPRSFWIGPAESMGIVSLGIVGATHRHDSGLGAIWTTVRLLEPDMPETARRLRDLGYEPERAVSALRPGTTQGRNNRMNTPITRDLDLDIAVAREVLGWTIRLDPKLARRRQVWRLYDNRDQLIAWDFGAERRTLRYYRTEAEAWEHAVPPFSISMSACWKVVEAITDIPMTRERAVVAPNTRFIYWIKTEAALIFCDNEAGAARSICEKALELARLTEPLFR